MQRLEAMEKNNEQIKRENQLFESYLLRKSKEGNRENDMEQKMKALKNKGNENKSFKLSHQWKYDIAAEELQELKSNI